MVTDRRTLSFLVILLAVGMVSAIGLCGATPVLAGGAGDAAAETDPATKADQKKSDEQAARKNEDDVGELFPGVKGISGKELARRIAEIERRKKKQQKQRPTAPGNTTPRRPASTGSTTSRRPAGTTGDRATEPSAEKPSAQEPRQSEASLASLDEQSQKFLKNLHKRTSRLERILAKASEIRKDADSEAKKLGNEARIQYYLRYRDGYIRETRAYFRTMLFPILVYRYAYDQATSALRFDRDNRPADLPGEALATVEGQVAKLREARRVCLIAAAELYTQVRRMGAAEAIYRVLLKRYPADQEVKKSYAAFVAVRDAPKPSGPPGIQRNARYEVDPRESEGTGGGEGGEGEAAPKILRWHR
ncbi:MAG: hypothetical protein GWP05_04055 [Anaerolineaceae bacterium]|nr:hypothetical protein [Anaerolineaceae bacterium]